MTATERLAGAKARLAALEHDHDRLFGVIEGLVAVAEQLARLAGAEVPASKPVRPALHVIQGGASRPPRPCRPPGPATTWTSATSASSAPREGVVAWHEHMARGPATRP